MVPHGRVEEALQDLAMELSRGHEGALDEDAPAPAIAVTAVEDEKKGEQLVVLHAGLPFDAALLHEGLGETDLPNLFQPKPAMYFEVGEIPMLGTGKVDLKGLKDLAEAVVEGPARRGAARSRWRCSTPRAAGREGLLHPNEGERPVGCRVPAARATAVNSKEGPRPFARGPSIVTATGRWRPKLTRRRWCSRK